MAKAEPTKLITGLETTRRDFLKATAVTGLALSLSSLSLKGIATAQPPTEYIYRSWEDLYRKEWTWDKVVKATHAHANCAGGCAFDVYVKDGIVLREEQLANYPPTNAELPDFNPRGCQKGACYSELMYNANRIKYPLKRVGERGEGKWKRISWDEALTEIADKMIDVIQKDGPEAIVSILGTQVDFGAQGIARMKFFSILGAVVLDDWGTQGDVAVGAAITWGDPHPSCASDNWFNSDYIILWTFNPVYTRIPDAHYLYEARYKGATVVCIAPDLSPSSIHTDLWLNPKVGSDTALALGMARVIIDEKLYDIDHIKEQTDLPFLVREDTGRFLREADLEGGGKEDIFYFWDLKSNQPTKAPGCQGHPEKSLRLGQLDPALEGSWEVELAGGQRVKVRPVFEYLKDMLKDYSLDKVAQITGVNAGLIRQVAQGYARAKAGLIISSWGSCKHYHTDLMQRSRILLVALCGHVGKPGGGYDNLSIYPLEGFHDVAVLYSVKVRKVKIFPGYVWLYVHGGLRENSGKKQFGDRSMKRNVEEYVMESIEKGWMPILPKPGKDPKIMVECGGNILRKSRSNHLLRKHLWPKLDLIVDINTRMDSTALNSDIVLPAAGWYEKPGLRYPVVYTPFMHITDKAVEPLHESKPEWEIFMLLAQNIQQRSKEKGFTRYPDDFLETTLDLGKLVDTFTNNGKLPGPEHALRYILENSIATKGIRLEEVMKKGFERFIDWGPEVGQFAKTSEWKADQPYVWGQYYTVEKRPWRTLTGRQQFYIDHEWFLEFGEALPVHKDPPQAGGNFPLRITGGHARWSIHSTWRDDLYMLRLQRGEPVMYMNSQDGAQRGIKDHDYVRVYNDVNSIKIRVKLSPAVQRGQVIIYHAWEPYQFPDQKCFNTTMPTPLKPLQMVGNYGQLHYLPSQYQPQQCDRDTLVEVEKA